jgi:hypothetical protein
MQALFQWITQMPCAQTECCMKPEKMSQIPFRQLAVAGVLDGMPHQACFCTRYDK